MTPPTTPVMLGAPKGSFIAFFAAFIIVGASGASARAATEFCPASMIGWHTKLRSYQPATTYYYWLRALGPRVADGIIVADTDQGWFTWTQQAVPLTWMTYTLTQQNAKPVWVVAESPEMSVAFPQPVHIRRTWIVSARAQADPYFGWEVKGTVTCAPPDFATMFGPNPDKIERTPRPSDPTPAPAPPTATAVPMAAPSPAATCDHPFVAAKVTAASQPVFPQAVKDEGFSQYAVSEIYVAIDKTGKLADAWVFASSGYPELDRAALDAAKRSRYAAPISYCQPVYGTYLFRADFAPN